VCVIHILINSIRNKEELSDQWKEFIIVPIHKNGYKTKYKLIVLINYIKRVHCFSLDFSV
jgi:hypothetical protein